MSNAKSVKSTKSVKIPKQKLVKKKDGDEETVPTQEPKKRAPRAKKQVSKEETLKMLSDASNELKQIIQELKEDEMKLSPMQLKRIPELVKETLKNLEEDVEEIDEQHKEISSLPEESK